MTLSVALASSCLAFPQLSNAHAQEASSSDLTCDKQYTLALAAENLSSTAPTVQLRSIMADTASKYWFNVALMCPGRYAQGIVHSVVDSSRASSLPEFLVSQQQVEDITSVFNTTEASASMPLHADTLQNLAVAEDRVRFAYETLAARGENSIDAQGLVLTASTYSQTFAYNARVQNSKNYTDTRERIYDVTALTSSSASGATSTVVDSATGLSMSLSSAIELDAGLEELRAMSDDSATQSSSSSSHMRDAKLRSISQRICKHFTKAFSSGAPALLSLYLQ